MKPTTILVIAIVVAVVVGAGGYMLLKRGPSVSAPEGFTQTGQTTQGGNTITTYSGTGTTTSASSSFRTWMEGQGWQYKMENGSFGGYTANLYEKGNEMAVVQATSTQAGQVTVTVVSGPKPSGPSDDQQPSSPTSAPSGSLIQPSNLEYKGAFRLPAGLSEDIGWQWGGSAMAFYPDGDSGGPSDGYTGSIFGAGHNQTQYISEISIPVPVVSSNKNPSDLNTATTLRQFTNVRTGISALEQLFANSSLNRVGMEYLPAQGAQTSGKLYLCWGGHFQEDLQNVPSHMWCDLNLTNQQGSWRILDDSVLTLYGVNEYMFEIPENWADNYFGGRQLATGRYRDGGWGGMGPSLFAIAPWAAGNPPTAGTTLPATTLLRYASTHQEGYQYGGNYKMDNYQHSDEWVGGAWLTADNRSSVILIGTKGTGTKSAWYGYSNGLVWPDEEPFPAEPGYPHEERGWWTESFEAQILFYNPYDFISAANGSMQPYEPQPYASMSIDSYLFNLDKVNHPDFADSLNKYRLGACCYDRSRQLLYIFEYRGDSETDRPLCHVFKVN